MYSSEKLGGQDVSLERAAGRRFGAPWVQRACESWKRRRQVVCEEGGIGGCSRQTASTASTATRSESESEKSMIDDDEEEEDEEDDDKVM